MPPVETALDLAWPSPNTGGMKQNLALLACLLLFPAASLAQAASPEVPAPTKAEPENTEIVTPLNVRDPSALVMGPAGRDKDFGVAVQPAPRAPERGAKEARAVKTASDKTPLQLGKLAVALPIDEDQLLGVKPGDRVDVISVFDAVLNSGPAQPFSATVLQNARVLSVAATDDLRAQGVLTLELNPLEAQYAFLTARRTQLGLAVRAPGNAETHPMEMATFGKLFR